MLPSVASGSNKNIKPSLSITTRIIDDTVPPEHYTPFLRPNTEKEKNKRISFIDKNKKTKSDYEIQEMIKELIKSAKPKEDITEKIRHINQRYYRPTKPILNTDAQPFHPLFFASAKTKRKPFVEQTIFDQVFNHTLKCCYEYFIELKGKFPQLNHAVITKSVSIEFLFFLT